MFERPAEYSGEDETMNYITNKDYISTAALHDPNYLSHGISWGSHRYIKREGTPGHYTYTYPEDLRNVGQNLVSGAKNLASRAGNTVQNAGQAVGRAIGITQRKEMQKAQGQYRAATAKLNRSMSEYDGTDSSDQRFKMALRNQSRAAHNVSSAESTYSKTPLGRAEQATRDVREFIKSIPDEIKYQVEVGIPYDVDHFINSTVGVQSRRNLVAARNEYNAALEAYKDAAIAAGTRTSNSYFLVPVDSESRAIVNRLDSAFDKVRDARRAYGKSWLGSMENLLNTNLMKYSWY